MYEIRYGEYKCGDIVPYPVKFFTAIKAIGARLSYEI
jgi:hypothetical protein